MKTSSIPYCVEIPNDWHEVPNRYLFEYHSTKVGGRWKDYQLLSLTTSGVKEKDINAGGGKVPDSYDNYQTVEPGDMIFCLFDLDVSAVFSGLSHHYGMITSAYDVVRPNKNILFQGYADYWFQYVFSNRYYKMYSKNIRYTITSEMFKAIRTLIPPMPIQRRIAEFLNKKTSEIDSLIEIENEQIEKLKEYKQAVITETVTKGLDPTAPMKDSGVEWIGEIPEGWSICRVKNIGFTQNGISKSSDFFGSGNPFVSYGDVYKNWELPNTGSGLIESTEKEQNVFSVCKGDIFFTRTSETIEEVGFSSVCFETIENAVFAGFLIRLRPYLPESVIISDYAKYYFRANLLRKYLVKEMNIVTRASLSQELLSAMSVVLPPKKNQMEIASFLDKKCKNIDSLIEIKQKKIDKLNEYKKLLIYECVTGKKEVI